MAATVLVTAPRLAHAGVEVLRHAGARVIYTTHPDDPAEVEALMAREPVDAVISRTVRLSADAIASCPTLKVVSKHGVGVSNIDVSAATARGIPVFMTPGANATSVAELAVGLMLAAARHVGFMHGELRSGRWTRSQDGIELRGRSLGLVGFGQVAQKVARIALAMEMKVHACDPGLQGQASPVPGVTMEPDLNTLLPLAQVLSLHVPLTARTRGMIGARELALLPKDAVFVNTARGEVVDEPALIQALQRGALHSAGLDTMAVEPLPEGHPLARLANVVLTPHVGGSTPAALAQMASGAAENVMRWLAGKPVDPRTCVNPETLSTDLKSQT